MTIHINATCNVAKTCNVNAVIEDGKQDDLLAPLQRIADRDGISMTMTDDAV